VSSTVFEGTIAPANQFTIAAPATAVVQRLLVRVGDSVTAGQPLLVADDREARTSYDAAQMDLRAADAQLDEARRRLALLQTVPAAAYARASGRLSTAQRDSEQVPTRQWRDSPERADAAYDLAKSRAERLRKLFDQGLVARQEYEDAEIGLRVAANDVENAKRAAAAGATLRDAQSEQSDLQWQLARAEQQQQRAGRQGEVSLAQLRRDEAALKVKAATDRLAASTVTASTAGVIIELPARAGDLVYAGAPLARLAVLDPLLVDVQVAPALVNALHPDQPAIVRLPGLPVREVRGTVSSVNPMPNRNGNHDVQVRFANDSGALLAGQPAEVRFQVP
jgi:multidrug efflux pump subunit AcrA (membrane-fusion protein)